MTANEIVKSYLEARHKIIISNDGRIDYEIMLCENDGTRSFKNCYRFRQIKAENDNLVLMKNERIIKTLTPDNVVWIKSIYAIDKHMCVLIKDFDYMRMGI